MVVVVDVVVSINCTGTFPPSIPEVEPEPEPDQLYVILDPDPQDPEADPQDPFPFSGFRVEVVGTVVVDVANTTSGK